MLPDDATHLASLDRAARAAGLAVADLRLPDRRSVLVGDHRLHLVDWGGHDLSPIVFAHGAGLTARTWDLTCLALTPRHRCLAVDLRGHGDSEWSPHGDYAPATMASDLAALVDTLDERPVLVGHSMGALAAVRCALDHDITLRGLVIVDIGPSSVPRSLTPSDEPVAARPPLVYDTFDDFVDHAMRLNPRRDRAQLRVSLSHNARRLPDGRWTWKYDQRHFGRGAARPAPDQFAQHWVGLEQLSVPTLVLRGADSPLLDAHGAADLADQIPGGRWVEIPDAGHTVHGDNPAAFIAALSEFVDSL